jgi:hypothetical protein
MLLKGNGSTIIASDVEFARTLLSQIKGLMFRRNIPQSYALIFDLSKPQKISLHMLFVPFPIDVVFLNEHRQISSTCTLRPWIGLGYSRKKVRYVIELSAGTIDQNDLRIGDVLDF